jgi:hypothetical protein
MKAMAIANSNSYQQWLLTTTINNGYQQWGNGNGVTTHPAYYWQKVAHAGKTAQLTRGEDKAWAVAHADLVCMWPK